MTGAINLKLSEIYLFLAWLKHYLFERSMIPNYAKDQEKQFENDQGLQRDTTDKGIISVSGLKKSRHFCCYRKKTGS